MAAPIPFDAPVTTATLPSSFFEFVFIFVLFCCCINQAADPRRRVRSVKKGQAALRDATRKTRTWDNRHWGQPIPDAACARHHASAFEVAHRMRLHRTRL